MIRSATEADLEDIAYLEMLLFPENCLNEHSLSQELGTSRAFVWGTPAKAYCIVRFGPELIDILRVGVRPEAQGRGIGRRMLEAILEDAYLPAMLTVRKDNEVALRLYRRMGFQVVGMLPQAEALLMQRPLTSSSR